MAKYRATVKILAVRNYDLSGFLDMLRYDQSRIDSWSREGDYYIVNLSRDNLRHTSERWRSFGISISEVD